MLSFKFLILKIFLNFKSYTTISNQKLLCLSMLWKNKQEHCFIHFVTLLFQGDEGILTAEYTGEAHFGGFMTRADDEFKSGRGNNRKDFIDNLIKAGP